MRKLIGMALLAASLGLASQAQAAKTAEGHLVLSIGATERAAASSKFEVSLRQLDGRAKTRFLYDGPALFSHPDFKRDGMVGKVMASALPAGEYEIFAVGGVTDNGLSRGYWQSHPNFSIRFTIAPGRITYVGQFLARPNPNPPTLAAMLDPWPYVLSDEHDRDVPVGKAKLKVDEPVDLQVADPRTVRNPYIEGS